MKDLQLKDIFPKKTNKITRVSIKYFGRWTFATPTQTLLVRQTEGQNYFRMTSEFGVLREGANDPSRTTDRGLAGDYLVQSNDGTFFVLLKQSYDTNFPKPITTP